jgi:hypothetical protein
MAEMFKRIKRAWAAFLNALFANEPISLVAPVFEIPATDWHKWECEKYTDCPVFWFDPYRYAGTKFDFYEPAWEAYGRLVAEGQIRHGIVGFSKVEIEPDKIHSIVRHPDPYGEALKFVH